MLCGTGCPSFPQPTPLKSRRVGNPRVIESTSFYHTPTPPSPLGRGGANAPSHPSSPELLPTGEGTFRRSPQRASRSLPTTLAPKPWVRAVSYPPLPRLLKEAQIRIKSKPPVAGAASDVAQNAHIDETVHEVVRTRWGNVQATCARWQPSRWVDGIASP